MCHFPKGIPPGHVGALVVDQHDEVAHRPQRGIGEARNWTLAVPGASWRRGDLALEGEQPRGFISKIPRS